VRWWVLLVHCCRPLFFLLLFFNSFFKSIWVLAPPARPFRPSSFIHANFHDVVIGVYGAFNAT
jgi:hypothetical protein